MSRPLTTSLLAATLAACSLAPERSLSGLELPPSTTQVLLSMTAGWNATAATLVCLERDGAGWRRVGAPIAARVGDNGLGWGVGLHLDGDGPKKQEGDGRAPAGVFALGSAFGYAAAAPDGVTFPYRQATERDYFIDDVDAAAYNQWVRIEATLANEPGRHWQSFEHMRRDDMQYEVGMVICHNTAARVPGRGSAIFLHVWKNPDNTTSGCTAMAKADLLRVMAWLRRDAEPRLIQLPRSELPRLRVRD